MLLLNHLERLLVFHCMLIDINTLECWMIWKIIIYKIHRWNNYCLMYFLSIFKDPQFLCHMGKLRYQIIKFRRARVFPAKIGPKLSRIKHIELKLQFNYNWLKSQYNKQNALQKSIFKNLIMEIKGSNLLNEATELMYELD